MPAIYTSALVALVQSTHPHHLEARRRVNEASTVLLHPSVVTEFTTVLRRHGKDAGLDGNVVARQALKSILDQPRVRIEASVSHANALQRYLSTPGLSFTDATVAEFRWHHDRQDPITFDPAITKAASKTAST